MSKARATVLWLIVLTVLTVYAKGRVMTSFDSGYSVHLALSLIEEGNLDLEEYRDIIPPSDYRVVEIDGVLYSRYPVGPSVVAAPIVSILASLGKYLFFIWDLDTWVRHHSPTSIERFLGSFFTTASALMIFFIAKRRLGYYPSLGMMLVFAFCTSAWSVTSRAFWQHGPSMLFLAATLYVLLAARDRPSAAQYAGLFVALAYTMRPTNALSVVLVSLYVLVAHRDQLWRYLAWATPAAVFFIAHNLAISGHILPWYYRQAGRKFTLLPSEILVNAAGQLLSPGRGLFVYSPIFLFALIGAAVLWRQGRWRALETCLASILVLHWLLISSWTVWWGGTVYGPRLFADMLPFLTYFLLPFAESLQKLPDAPWRRRILAMLFSVAIAWSFFVHRAGAVYWATWDWNIEPVSVEKHPERLWDWRDPAFLRRVSETHP